MSWLKHLRNISSNYCLKGHLTGGRSFFFKQKKQHFVQQKAFHCTSPRGLVNEHLQFADKAFLHNKLFFSSEKEMNQTSELRWNKDENGLVFGYGWKIFYASNILRAFVLCWKSPYKLKLRTSVFIHVSILFGFFF